MDLYGAQWTVQGSLWGFTGHWGCNEDQWGALWGTGDNVGISGGFYRALRMQWGSIGSSIGPWEQREGLYGHWGDKRAQWGALLGTGNAMGISGGL